ncbi:MAG: hypothetical protein R3250_15635 [Melioribacteraceae bacterium]|nr:hypothetical protein [Melioribacteraceae bacterium]
MEDVFVKHEDTEDLSDIEMSNADDSDDEMDTEQKKITEEFKENVVKFVKLDDQIRERKREIRELESKRKPCEEFILKCLDSMNENVIEISNGKLRKNKSETKVPLNQDIIRTAILEKVQDPKQVSAIVGRMDELRPKKTRVNLKRTMNRKKK